MVNSTESAISFIKKNIPEVPEFTANGDRNCVHLFHDIMEGRSMTELFDQCIQGVPSLSSGIQTPEFFGLSFLSVAAIANRVDVAQKYCQQSKVFPIAKGEMTPAHIRAILSGENSLEKDPFYKTLKDTCGFSKKQLAQQNELGGTPKQLFQYVKNYRQGRKGPFKAIPNIEIDSQCMPKNKEFKYVSKSAVRPDQLAGLWLKSEKFELKKGIIKDPKQLKETQEALRQYKFSKPSLIIDSKKGVGCGVTAVQDIPAGQVVTTYDGELLGHKAGSTDYDHMLGFTGVNHQFLKIGAEKLRGVAAMVNDGPPNIKGFTVPKSGGLPGEVVLVSLGIKKGEAILHDYTMHNIKYQNTFIEEADYQDVVRLIQTKDVSKQFGNVLADYVTSLSSSNTKEDLLEVKRVHRLMYVLTTPSVMFRLINEGVLTLQDFDSLYSTGDKLRVHFYDEILPVSSMRGFLLTKTKTALESMGRQDLFNKVLEVVKNHFCDHKYSFESILNTNPAAYFMPLHAHLFKSLNRLIDDLEAMNDEDCAASSTDHVDALSLRVAEYENEWEIFVKDLPQTINPQRSSEYMKLEASSAASIAESVGEIIEKHQLITAKRGIKEYKALLHNILSK